MIIKLNVRLFILLIYKYLYYNYYKIYLLLITIFKNLFDINLFIRKEVQINKVKYAYYILDGNVLWEHQQIINKLNNSNVFID
jgi:hypothetical protein